MSTPLVSVVIPAYNRATTIRAAVESALRQTVQEIEVLVVDDASSDETAAIASGIGDRRVEVLLRDRNGGASAARNTGIRHARGAFIAFLDSDDVWLEEKLARQLAALRAAPDEIAVSCTGAEIHLLDHGGVVRLQYLEPMDDWKLRLAMGCDLSPGTTQMSRRHIFSEVGPLDETLPRFEDWDWLLRYTQMGGRIAAVKDPLAQVYNRRARLGDVVEKAAVMFLAKHRDVIGSLPERERRKAVADLWLQVVGTFAFEGRLKAAVPSMREAMRERPIHTTCRLVSGALAVVRGKVARRIRSGN